MAKRKRALKPVPPGKMVTTQQRILMKGLLSGKTLTESAKEAGYRWVESASHTTRTRNFREAYLDLLDEAGLGPADATAKLKQLFNAEKLVDGMRVSDNQAQLGALTELHKVTGAHAPTKAEVAMTEPEGGVEWLMPPKERKRRKA